MTTKERFVERFNSLANEYPNKTAFARALNMSQQTVNYWLNGNRIPDAANLTSISKATGVTVDYLLGLSEVKRPDAELQAVSKYTGLTDEALHTLTNPVHYRVLNVLNQLLADDKGTEILEWIDRYLETDFSNVQSAYDYMDDEGQRKLEISPISYLQIGKIMYSPAVLESAVLDNLKERIKEYKKEEETKDNGID